MSKRATTKIKEDFYSLAQAQQDAIRLAKEGPRVAAVLRERDTQHYLGAPGYLDTDTRTYIQVQLVTPDGRIWIPEPPHMRGK